MKYQADGYPEQNLLDYGRLRERFLAGHDDYVNADPFPHIALDDFVSADVVDALLEGFPDPGADINWRQLRAKCEDG